MNDMRKYVYFYMKKLQLICVIENYNVDWLQFYVNMRVYLHVPTVISFIFLFTE